ncbi:COG4223 family protein [Devosia sp.]|uniref:COG4223 family protein n=1 Tax=Devosia sp. TaxID=1871048 RepID=UPI003A8EDEAE
MAERKSGPVKPPVIDAKARDNASADGDKSAAQSKAGAEAKPGIAGSRPTSRAEPKSQTPPPAAPPRPKARLAMPWDSIAIAAVAGALLGTALTYGLVNLLPLPNSAPQIADPAPQISALESEQADLASRLSTVEISDTDLSSRLDTLSGQLDTALADVRSDVAALPPPADLSALEAQVAALEDRVSVLGAGATSADASELANTITNLEQSFAALSDSIDTLSQRSGAGEAALAELRDEVDAVRSATADQPSGMPGDLGPAVRLPLLVSGLENSFASGRPYQVELDGLTGLLPDLEVPAEIASAAADGLPRPDAVSSRFDAAVPQMMAAQGSAVTGDWGQDALDWMKGILAVRPAGEMDGDAPDAVMSRLEAAVARRDFPAAETLLSDLPETMQTAAGPVADDIRTLAAAEAFITTLRGRVLSPSTSEASQ